MRRDGKPQRWGCEKWECLRLGDVSMGVIHTTLWMVWMGARMR